MYSRFVEVNSGFEQKYKPKLNCPETGNRWYTFRVALNIVAQNARAPRILETGCVRAPDDYMAGYSTVVFGDFCEQLNGELISVDTNADNIRFAQRALAHARLKQFAVKFVNEESVTYLETLLFDNVPGFDLIYLDALDYDANNPLTAQQHQYNEVQRAVLLTTLILLDDCNLPGGGKGLKAKKFLADEGWLCLLDDYQSLWIKQE